MDRLGEELAEYEGDIGVRNGRATENSVPLMCNSKLLVRQRPLFGQLVIASLVYLAAFCCGLTGGFSGVLLPQLQANSSDLSTDDEMGSWIVSVYTGATSVGCLISGVIMNVAGRRLTVQIAVICMSVGWVLISLAHSHTLMLIGRALDGFGRGLSVPAFTFHLEETSDPRLRGTLSACILLAYSIGIMAVSMLGTALDWRIVAGLGVVISLLDLIGYSFLPESPVWLARNSRVNQAQEVYNWLWGNAHHKQFILSRGQQTTACRPNLACYFFLYGL
ncbi:facilitated trehalose transporter Tret1-like [Periplaneta americana]|uniref:facilitated trehalose transporter Tret1-like n=1 Tax=Periplaneta americana TaxID=6978 RepID=UPI0037E92B74